METKDKYAEYKVAYDELQEHSPSVIRYTPMLWTLKWILKVLLLLAVVFFLSTFIQPIWEGMHSAIIDVDYIEEQSMKTLLHTARAGLLIIFIVSWLALKFSQFAIRRNWYILDLSLLTEEMLDYLKEKSKE